MNFDIKWVLASKKEEEDWVVRFLSGSEKAPELEPTDLSSAFHRMIEEDPFDVSTVSQYAVFKNEEEWRTKAPVSILDFSEVE